MSVGIGRARQVGASAVGLGSPYACELAAGGEDGGHEVIRNLRADFDLTIASRVSRRCEASGSGNVVRS